MIGHWLSFVGAHFSKWLLWEGRNCGEKVVCHFPLQTLLKMTVRKAAVKLSTLLLV